MFYQATIFNQPIGNWDVSNVTSMNTMFRMSDFNQQLNSWNVSKVSNMGGMFKSTPFNQNISDWDVSNVTAMDFMFQYASLFNQDISGWDVLNVTNYIDYGSGSGHSNSNFTSSNLYRYFRYIFDDSTLQSAIDLHYDTETIQATFGNNYWGAPTRNGPIQLYKGKTYIFDWSNVDHSYAGGPFKIYTTNPSGVLTENVIIDTNAETTTLTVTETTPTQLKYGGGGWGSPPNEDGYYY